MAFRSGTWYHFICLLIVSNTSCSDHCEPWEIKRNDLCCTPVFNCRPGFQVLNCTLDEPQETCTPCPEGTVQPDMISSFSEQRECFESQQSCVAADLSPTSKARHRCVPKYCKCNNNNCFYEETCTCRRANECRINETLNATTGACVPCEDYEYKNTIGCGPCLTNVAVWKYNKGKLETITDLSTHPSLKRQPQQETGLPISTASERPSSCPETKSETHFFLATIILSIFLVIFGIPCVLLVLLNCRNRYLKKSRNTTDQNPEGVPLQNQSTPDNQTA